MTTKIPTKVHVCGKPYVIRLTRKLGADAENLGVTSFSSQDIEVLAGQAPQCERDTVLHEITHVIDLSLALGMKERQVHAVACAMLDVLRSNPQLVRYLCQ